MTRLQQQRRYDVAKRVLDIVGASVVLIASAPLQLVVAGAVAAQLGRPVLFKQDRPGLHGQIFMLRKFRTMRDVSVSQGLVSDDERLTRFGRILRSTSLDELPTLFNVIKGDMSVVGPRPLLVRYLKRYSPSENRRHEVRPGMTGLAQVSGRNALSWSQKFELDVEYVDHRSCALDASIVLRTLKAVLLREGVTAEGNVAMPEFEQGVQNASK
ncbi:sugar transferase [Cryobacterium sp. TMT1-3]|uniref:sugar transferase n=1 Tax=Cryobacterium sp. TMT1-3 TaxID=1259237 RepID=UPI0010694313|nr:sugar transferase [Cryobacterium sp. TMT1-3]TFC29347.1 sugar transferase [Cryobacterium sp. TMT1-3]